MVANLREQKIYIFIELFTVTVFTYSGIIKQNGQKMKTFLQETIFQKGEVETFPVHSGPLSLNKQPLNPQITFTDL